MAVSPVPQLDVTAALTGKRVLFAGATGFVGKVSLSMLLHRYGEQLAKVYVLVRKGSSASAQARFFDKVATSEPFEPLRTKYGEAGSLEFLRKKCVVLEGDVTDPWAGLPEADGRALKGNVDLVINCAGLVSFNPSLEVGLNVNTHGVRYLAQMCVDLDVPLVHMSTSFVAGMRSGLIFEDEEVKGYFPRRDELDGRDFSLELELSDAAKLIARLRESADDKALTSTFRQKAIDRLEAEGRDATDEKALRLAVGRERKLWLTTRQIEVGMERAKHWGWPNTYTYTKSLGEQVIVSTPGLAWAIVRPSVVESAVHYPFPGWNEGFTTSAPLSYALIKGQNGVPAGDKTILDLIPVDMVAGSLIAIAAHTLLTRECRVYQQASGDVNPFFASRSIEIVGLYKRRFYRRKKTGNRFMNDLLSRIEPEPMTKAKYELMSSPMFLKGVDFLKKTIEEQRPTWGAPKLDALLTRAQDGLDDFKAKNDTIQMIVGLFLPFIWENQYVFRCDNTRALYARLAPHDRALIPWAPEGIDWRTYFLDVHLGGLEKWVFPGLDEESEKRTVISAHRDLVEMFDAAVHAFRHRVAFRMIEGEREQRFTYGEVHRYAGRVASFLLKTGLKHQDRVLLLSENRPEWGITYFGVLKAGGTVVPVDAELKEAEVVNLARASRASVCLISDEAALRLPALHRLLAEAGVATQVHSLAQALEGDPSVPGGVVPLKRVATSDDVASLIFTSGTTGTPKGVMLTHRNFAALVAKLAGVFAMAPGDGVLSVLPMHHTFEFSAGFLTPFSRGAEVSYLDEITADRIGEVLETGRITGMIGVPALWQLFHRKITQELAARPRFVEQAIKGLMGLNGELRNSSDFNLGKLLFWPVHRKFGGNLKHLVSGGSALSEEVHKAFHELGFTLAEGYGLTESAPVLTVAEPSNTRVPGSVGKALPGIELKIHAPDGDGLGEVIAKGPNVMAGYYEDRDATDAVLKNGWLHTGDLGRIDGEGRLFLVGRMKDVIIDANGKNVYPDELEELYEKHARIKELSIVGLPDDSGGEKVACLCVPDYGELPRDEVRRTLEEHFKTVSTDLPFYRRVKLLRLWDGELPRTSTLKVKRKLVVEELKRQDRIAASGEKARASAAASPREQATDWLAPLIAELINRPVAEVRPEANLSADLGFDSLMLTELQVALENAGVALTASADLTRIQTVEDLRRLVTAQGRKPSAELRAKEISREVKREEDPSKLELELPEAVARAGRSVLELGQRAIYGGVFDVKTHGKSFIPANRNFLVVANHASHLDMGLVKVVLGEQGERLVALAARDYFFDTPLKRAYFENFTNLIPMERNGSLRESLRLAGESLTQGFNLLIFPEGTRSEDGSLAEFKPTLGYLALTFGVDVLPLYLGGTHAALPKGALWPKREKLVARIGPPLLIDSLRGQVKGMARSEGYRYVTRLAEEAVRALSQGRVYSPGDLKVSREGLKARRSDG